LLIFDEVTDKTKLAPFFYGSRCSINYMFIQEPEDVRRYNIKCNAGAEGLLKATLQSRTL